MEDKKKIIHLYKTLHALTSCLCPKLGAWLLVTLKKQTNPKVFIYWRFTGLTEFNKTACLCHLRCEKARQGEKKMVTDTSGPPQSDIYMLIRLRQTGGKRRRCGEQKEKRCEPLVTCISSFGCIGYGNSLPVKSTSVGGRRCAPCERTFGLHSLNWQSAVGGTWDI